MKQKVRAPSPQNLLKVYNKFQMGSAALADLMLNFEWVRFDPRLGEILISYIKSNWSQWNPMDVQQALPTKEWPQVFAVLCEHVHLLLHGAHKKKFKAWMDCTLAGTQPATAQLFSGYNYAFGGKLSAQEAFNSLKIYKRWGYYSATPLIAVPPAQQTLLKKKQRQLLLKELVEKKPRISVNDYINHLGGNVSRRVAELDLSIALRKSGKTRGSTYK